MKPSPVRLSRLASLPKAGESATPPGVESTLTNIDLSSSFNLFNDSFDMNLEGLIGPNSSFGYLGPMKSLSFGLGLNGSVDYGDVNMRMSPNTSGGDGGGMMTRRQQYLKMSTKNNKMENEDDDDNIFGVRCDGNGVVDVHPNESEMQPKKMHDEKSTSSFTTTTHDIRSSTSEANTRVQVLNGSAMSYGNDVFRKTSTPAEYNNQKQPHAHTSPPRRRQQMEPSLLGAMEQHHSIFSKFSFLLPGAKVIIDNRSRGEDTDAALVNSISSVNHFSPTERETEVARRRVNSALCAFGGVAFPSSENCDSMDSSERLRWMQRYKDSIPDRYYEDESRLSWEIEENPPIEISDWEEEEEEDNDDDDSMNKNEGFLVDHPGETDFQCKLCGDTNRQHDCPFQSSHHRNIGVMVYPAVNAFTATEPGIITPALSEINNFVDNDPPTESTPAKTLEELNFGTESYVPMVTPDSIQRSVNYAGGAWISNHQSPQKVSPSGKSPNCQSTDLLFLDTQELQPEQYRAVVQNKIHKKRKSSSSLARIRYLYPALPLPYGQRKRISNVMFAMSKSIPGLTDECASVLGEARREDAWDFAVAQLMTQVIVVTHCSVEDRRLDGLSKYLLTLG